VGVTGRVRPSRSRAARLALAAAAISALALPPAGMASAQASDVTIHLVTQSAWNAPDKPLRMTVSVTNRTDAAFEDLSLALTIEAPARSRTVYEESLRAPATSPILTLTTDREGSLGPGRTRRFPILQPLDALTARGESALYPLEVQVRSADAPIATLRSPLLFVVDVSDVRVPLDLAWTWVLSAPVEFRPDGTFVSDDLERAVAPGGRIASALGALEDLGPKAATVALSATLVEQLEMMADGYTVEVEGEAPRDVSEGTGGAADAERALAQLRAVVGRPAVQTAVQPYGDPSVPALFRAGLGDDLPALQDSADAVVDRALGIAPARDVFRPPGSQLDPGTLAKLVGEGFRILLLDEGFIPTATSPFNLPGVVRLSGGGSVAQALLPDAGVAAVAHGYPDDPRLAAQAALGELAAIWFEFPGTPGRGVATLYTVGGPYPSAFLTRFATLVAVSPWLRPVTASALVAAVDPQSEAALAPRSYPTFAPAYVQALRDRRAQLRRYAETVIDPSPTPEELDRNLDLATAGTFIDDQEEGARFIASVRLAIERTYEGMTVLEQRVTLASANGVIPVVVDNATGHRLRVRVRLVSDRALNFPDGGYRDLVLGTQETAVRFPVHAQTTGLFSVKIQVLSASEQSSRDVVAENRLLVRSTAYNRVALFVTIGAGVFLLVWWGRRFLPRRRAARPTPPPES
jgi:hypothetical protein